MRATLYRSTCWLVASVALLQQLFHVSGYGKYNYNSYHSPSTEEVKVEIPYPVLVGQTVQLRCIWRVGSKGFYSLRWYKDEVQFYSLIRGGEGNVHHVTGLHVILQESDEHVVTLRGVTPLAEGTYKCEIMTDGPKFKIIEGRANLTVAELPETPQLLGVQHTYMAGDMLNVTCTAKNGRPAPTIAFKVNDVPIHEESGRVKPLPRTPGDRPGLSTSRTRLEMPVGESLQPTFRLGCYAYTHGLSVQEEMDIQVDHRRTFFSLFGGSSSNTRQGSNFLTFINIAIYIFVTFSWISPAHL